MPPNPNHDMMAAIFKMTKENNDLLHSMRRRAFIGGFLKFLIYAALFLAPVWFYATYLNQDVQKMLQAFNQMQQTGANVQLQFNNIQNSVKSLESKIPGFGGDKHHAEIICGHK